MSFGAQLVQVRDQHGVGRRKLHLLTGLSLSYLHEIENDTFLPSHDRLGKIVSALDLRPEEAAALVRARDIAELERMGFSEAALTLLLKEAGQLSPAVRRRIERALKAG